MRPIGRSRNVVRMLAATLVPEHCSSGHRGKLCRWSHLISSAEGQRNCWPTLKAVSCYPICQVSVVPLCASPCRRNPEQGRSRFVDKSRALKSLTFFANYVELITYDDNRLQPVCKPFGLFGRAVISPGPKPSASQVALRRAVAAPGAISQDRDIGAESDTDSFPDSA